MQDIKTRAKQSFWPRINKRSGVFGATGKYPTRCWEWLGGTMYKGYGVIQIANIQYRTHRLAWILHTGQSISATDFVCHDCDNTKCVRPSHLFLGNAKSNIRDRDTKQRQARGENQGLSCLTEKQVVEIRKLYSTGEYSHRQLAKRFKCSHSNIHYVLAGNTWKHSDTRNKI